MNNDAPLHRILSLVLCLLSISCNNQSIITNEPSPDVEQRSIRIESNLPSTRASELWSTDGGGDTAPLLEFGVYAYYNGTDQFMGDSNGGQIVARTMVGGEWNYTPLRLWPGTGFIDFYAYAPTGDGIRTTGPADGRGQRTLTNDIPPKIDFIVDSYSEFQIDLLLATAQKGKKRKDVIVSMPLRHALTLITFSARIDEELAQYAPGVVTKVDKIILRNIHTHGTHSMDASQPWTVFTEDAYKRKFLLERVPSGSSPAELADIELTTVYQKLSTKSGTLLMLPQPMDADKEVEVTFRVIVPGREDTIRSFIIPLEGLSPDWGQGDALNYLLLIRSNSVVLTLFGLPGSPA